MALSYFDNKIKQPTEKDLLKALGTNYKLWNNVKEFVYESFPSAGEEWNFGGKSLGWGFRLKDSKRVIVYLIPCDGFFKTGLVYGERAVNEAMNSKVSEEIKMIISSSKVYVEGRGFRIDVNNEKMLRDIKALVKIKLNN